MPKVPDFQEVPLSGTVTLVISTPFPDRRTLDASADHELVREQVVRPNLMLWRK